MTDADIFFAELMEMAAAPAVDRPAPTKRVTYYVATRRNGPHAPGVKIGDRICVVG